MHWLHKLRSIHRTESAALAAHLQNSPASAVRNTTPPVSPRSSTRSTVKRITLNIGSSVVYNRLGGTSNSAISKAVVHRHTSAVPVSTSTPEDFYKLFSMDQTKIAKSLNESNEDPVTDSGLVTSLKFFDDYNHKVSAGVPWPHLASNFGAGSGGNYSR